MPIDKTTNRAGKNFLSASAMLGHLCALYDKGVFEAGRLMSNLLFQLAVKRGSTNVPLIEQVGLWSSIRITVDRTVIGSNIPASPTMSPLVGLMFGLRDEGSEMRPAASWIPAVVRPGTAAQGFVDLPIDEWLDDRVIPTAAKMLSRRELIVAIRDQDGGAHSDPDAKLAKSPDYVELVNSFPCSKESNIRTPTGMTLVWDLLPPITLPLLRQIGHEMLSAIWSQTDIRDAVYIPSLVCCFRGTAMLGAFVPEDYPDIGLVNGKRPGVIRRVISQAAPASRA